MFISGVLLSFEVVIKAFQMSSGFPPCVAPHDREDHQDQEEHTSPDESKHSPIYWLEYASHAKYNRAENQ